MNKRILSISCKCSDSFFASARIHGIKVTYGPNYVPRNLGIGGGDYIKLEIDLDTGQIIDWKPIDNETLEEVFN